MHDPALWTNWYIALLLFPFMIIALLLRDFLAGRSRRRSQASVGVDFHRESSETGMRTHGILPGGFWR